MNDKPKPVCVSPNWSPWISVKDRLPDMEIYVCVYSKELDKPAFGFINEHRGKKTWSIFTGIPFMDESNDGFDLNYISQWIQLPISPENSDE